MIYVDTSVFVSSLTKEASSDKAVRWMTANPAGVLIISPWVETEFASALSLKRRMKAITDLDRQTAASAFSLLVTRHLRLVGVTRQHFTLAALFLQRHELGLRAPDALHLAIAATNEAALATLDKKLADAARACGLKPIVVG